MSTACMPVDHRPVIEPDADCEGCGARGTAGRASRYNDSGEFVEEHRYCADCWPQWSAYYHALWEEGGRRGTLEWPGTSMYPPPAWGMVFASATWHSVVELVAQLTTQYHRDAPKRDKLAQIAKDIRDHAAEKVGPMPAEVRAFLAEFGDASADAPHVVSADGDIHGVGY